MTTPPDKRKKQMIATAATVAIVISFLSISLTMCPERPSRQTEPIKQTGQRIAEETCRLLGNQGSVVVVTLDSDPLDVQLKAFRKTIAAHKAVRIQAVQRARESDLARGVWGIGLSAEYFLKLLAGHSSADALVSLVGPPIIPDEKLAELPPNRPRVVVFAPLAAGVRHLIARGVITLAIVPDAPAPPAGLLPATTTNRPEPYLVLSAETLERQPFFDPPIPPSGP